MPITQHEFLVGRRGREHGWRGLGVGRVKLTGLEGETGDGLLEALQVEQHGDDVAGVRGEGERAVFQQRPV